MYQSRVYEFEGDDEKYLKWIFQNPYGYVINTPRSMPLDYMLLHRSSCSTISEYTGTAKRGGFTERDYIKICAEDIDSLRSWVRQHGRPDGSFSGECHHCEPLYFWENDDD